MKFTHALLHEVAYGGLISAKRQTLHARVLRAMESQNQEKQQELVESLAHHALNAALWKEAVTYLHQAGDKAVELSAYREGGAFFELALQALTHLSQNAERVRQGIDIRLKLRPVFGATAEYDRLEYCVAEAEILANSIDDRPRLAAINDAWSFVHNWRGQLDASIDRCLRARNIAREVGNGALELGASFRLGQAYMWRGDSSNRSLYSRITWPGSMALCDICGSAPLGPARSCGWVCWELLAAVWATSRQRWMPHKRHVSSPTKFSDRMTLPWRIGGRASYGRIRGTCRRLCDTWSMVLRFAGRTR